MHYALVSDLLTKEAFDERVENKCEQLCGAVDEVCAAMLVVEELGRSHIRIGAIKSTTTALVSFFGKILEVTPPREFSREGGGGREGEEAEPGLVASMILGDPTGTVKMTLWDAQAAAVSELEVGSVVEVIAKPRSGYRNEVTCAALRPSQVRIVETKRPPKSEAMTVPLAAKILFIAPVREIPRRDGSMSELLEIIVGDSSGTARIITWSPELFEELEEGMSVSFAGLTRKEEEDVVEYVAGDNVVITPHADISVLSCDAGDVVEGQTSVVTGVALSASQVRTFVTRRGNESRVKNIRLGSEKGTSFVNVACWNEAADAAVVAGDLLEVINAQAKLNKYGEIELSIGRGSVLRGREGTGVFGTAAGMIIPRAEGLTIDDGTCARILSGDTKLPPAAMARVSGLCTNSRILVEEAEVEELSPAALRERLLRL
ncbi:hypothetical protein [Methanorbis rubei]|uniref:Replication factor A n=1 Tax=Methanorbis rubei TaxID=3028300 RepID=A0AAE4MHS2_9EURY|nr:hypothetical protein [Methanocorpusculaceae archaeon Cs1]